MALTKEQIENLKVGDILWVALPSTSKPWSYPIRDESDKIWCEKGNELFYIERSRPYEKIPVYATDAFLTKKEAITQIKMNKFLDKMRG